MGRIHLFEWEDKPWFPVVLRDAGTAYLSYLMRKLGHAAALIPKLVEVVERTGAERIVDLCSGGGAPARLVAEELAARKLEVAVVATDLFPNQRALAAEAEGSDGKLTFEREPVDATAVPERLTGIRTLFNAFHHFRPPVARRILEDAVRARQPIAVFEVLSPRHPLLLLSTPIFPPLLTLLVVPLLRPFRWAWIPLTYVLPLIPLFVMWDGFVSCLRIYSPAELRTLVDGLDDFEWEIGRISLPGTPTKGVYLVGTPAPV